MLLAGLAAFALPRFGAERVPTLDDRASAIARELGRLRIEAVGSGKVVTLAGATLAAGLPRGTSLVGAEPAEIVFYPNGMTNGASWRLEADGRSVALEVDWLTGRVAVHAP